MSDGRQNEEINTKRVLYRCIAQLSNTPKLSVFDWIFVPVLTYGHEYRVMTKIILSQVQAAEMGLLRRVHGVTLRE